MFRVRYRVFLSSLVCVPQVSSSFAHDSYIQLSPPAGTGTPQAVSSLSSTPPLAARSSSPAALAAALGRREPEVIDVDRDSNSEVQVVSPVVRSSASSSPSASSPARADRQFAGTVSPSPQQPALDRQAVRGRQQSPQRTPPVVTDEEVAASAAAAGIDVDSEVPPSLKRQTMCSLASSRARYPHQGNCRLCWSFCCGSVLSSSSTTNLSGCRRKSGACQSFTRFSVFFGSCFHGVTELSLSREMSQVARWILYPGKGAVGKARRASRLCRSYLTTAGHCCRKRWPVCVSGRAHARQHPVWDKLARASVCYDVRLWIRLR